MTKETIQNISIMNSETESRVSDYFSLLKPRVMYLVIFTAYCGLLIAPGHINPLIAFVAILAVALGCGASGAINMWYERDIDYLMTRTKDRPLPAGRIKPENALHYGVALAVISVCLMGLIVNIKSAIILAISILFYIFVYTIWLKKRTPQNIVIGGAAGAFPPIIGWCAVTNEITIEPLILFLIIFMWTPPHFWALSLHKSDDYKKAGIPMLPLVKGEKITKQHILLYSILLSFTSLLPYFIGMSKEIYLVSTVILNCIFCYYSFKLYREKSHKSTMKLFSFSIIYLFLLFSFLVFDNLSRSF